MLLWPRASKLAMLTITISTGVPRNPIAEAPHRLHLGDAWNRGDLRAERFGKSERPIGQILRA